MTDHEDTWMKRDLVTHQDLADESAAIVKALRKEHAKDIRDQLSYLQKTHTVALMAVEMFAHQPTLEAHDAATAAKKLYREVQKTLEIDRQITGHIPAA